MDWTALLADLEKAGLTQVQIAAECKVAQGTVSDLKRGATKSPGFEFGDRLRRLHAQRVQAAPAAPKAA